MPVGVIGAAAIGGLALGGASIFDLSLPKPSYSATVDGCYVTDGDTIRCGDERIRLVGIDAPELPGHCNAGRTCAPGDPFASTASLQKALKGPLRIERLGEDRYSRTIAAVSGSLGDLSCHQIRTNNAIYRASWDNGSRTARTCPTEIF